MFLATKFFTTGRIVFSITFMIAFVILMIYSYIKDAKNNRTYYNKSGFWVGLAIITVIALLFLSKYLVKTYNI